MAGPVRELSGDRFTAAVRDQLPAELADKALADTDDLFRALRAAELTGLPGEAGPRRGAGAAVAGGADSVPAVLASRVRGAANSAPPDGSDRTLTGRR